MKYILLFAIAVLFVWQTQAQSLSPQVISPSGDYFEGSNASLSWTLGELATETYTSGDVILTQGFQQPITVEIRMDVMVFLEGPYSNTEMTTNLNVAGEIPNSQPYTGVPWNYAGTESADPIPNADVVDWVLIELRDASSAATADGASAISRQAGLLLKDGSVVGVDGASNMSFAASFSNNLFVVVWHRNHLGILSANPLTQTAGVYTYDFTVGLTQAYGGGAGYKLIDAGNDVYGMAGGNTNGDKLVDASDKAVWTAESGSAGYLPSDHNLDAQSNNQDKDDTWIDNTSLSGQVPD